MKLTGWLEGIERSEQRIDEWHRKRRLKQALRDHRHGLPFIQVPSLLVTSGILKELRPSSIRVYLALLSRCHNTRRTTWIGLKTVGELTGLAPITIMDAYKELKAYALIARRRVARNGFFPYETKITPPSAWILPEQASSAPL